MSQSSSSTEGWGLYFFCCTVLGTDFVTRNVIVNCHALLFGIERIGVVRVTHWSYFLIRYCTVCSVYVCHQLEAKCLGIENYSDISDITALIYVEKIPVC